MKTLLLITAASLTVVLGCSENLDPSTPDGALHLVRNALLEEDVTQLVAQTSKRTRDTLETLHRHAKEQYAQIKGSYPPEHAMGAWGAYPPGMLSAQSVNELFIALTAERFKGLKRGPGLQYGMSASGAPVILGNTATVATKSGESVPFTLEDGAWKTTAFETVLSRNLERMVLNGQTLKDNLDALKTYSKDGKAPSAPQ